MSKKVLAIIGLVVAIAVVMIAFSSAQAKRSEPEENRSWIVHRGDTLWRIASENRGETEIRRYIYEIKKLNDIGSTIHPGQMLLLPPGK